MASTQAEAHPNQVTSRNSRTNEILAIGLFALGVLLALCLVSYHPNDPSWNAAGSDDTRNLVGTVGANVASALLQAIGAVAYLLPLFLIFAAWRRFRTRRIQSPLTRSLGLVMLILSVAALFSLINIAPLVDASFRAGGLAGSLLAGLLSSWLSNVGTTIFLVALAAMGLLLATNFSFIRAYENLVNKPESRLAFLRNIPETFRAWRERRREAARVRMEKRQAARAERGALRAAARREKTAAERVAEFMRDTEKSQQTEIQREVATKKSQLIAQSTPPVNDPLNIPGNGQRVVTAVEAMVQTASVVRTDSDDLEKAKELPAAAERRKASTRIVSYSDYEMPELRFLNAPPPHSVQADEELLSLATRLAEKCKEFNVTGQIKHICPGPVVTTYEFKPDPGVKYSRVTGLVDDLCLALKAESIRIDRMPGKPHVGIEVPNPTRETIYLREVLESRQFTQSPSKVTIALGKTIDGLNYVADLAKMPHLLIAGATGSGKSVGVNSLVVSILYKARPDEVKFIMIDPKRLELGLYEGIPHLATPIVNDTKLAANSLRWAVREMERRYKELASWSVRNIDGYNLEAMRRNLVEDFDPSGNPWKPLPYIVIIIDELADLMMASGNDVETAITRLAQMARAVGIHLVVATQRPSVDVITGLIKANFPSRIAYRVSSKVDSRTIIDSNGAEQLLGRGDMLFLPPGTSRLVRVHGAFVDEVEIGRIVDHAKAQAVPLYDESITQSEEDGTGPEGMNGEHDELFEEALRICVEMKRASTSVLQRRLRIGYGRAAAILDTMEREGFIGHSDGARARPVLGRAYETIAHWDEIPEDSQVT